MEECSQSASSALCTGRGLRFQQLASMNIGKSRPVGEGSRDAYRVSAAARTSGFTQASGVRPRTTSMAFCVQRRRSSTADSSDQ